MGRCIDVNNTRGLDTSYIGKLNPDCSSRIIDLVTNELAPLTLYKYKKRSLGRHRGALVALEMHCESSGTIFNDNQPRDLAWSAPLIMTSKWWRVAQSASFDFIGKPQRYILWMKWTTSGLRKTSSDEWHMIKDGSYTLSLRLWNLVVPFGKYHRFKNNFLWWLK